MFVQYSSVFHNMYLTAIWFQWGLGRYLDANCSKSAGPHCEQNEYARTFQGIQTILKQSTGKVTLCWSNTRLFCKEGF